MDRNLIVLCVAAGIVMLGVGIVGPILPFYALSFGVSYGVACMVISIFGVARLCMDAPAGNIADKLGRKPLIVSGMVVLFVSSLIAAFAQDIMQLLLARFVQGIGSALYTTTAMTLVADIAPPEKRGSYLGYYQGSFFLGAAAGPALGGFIAEFAGFRAPFFFLGILSALGASFAGVMVRESFVKKKMASVRGSGYSNLRTTFHNRLLMLSYMAGLVTMLMMVGMRFTLMPIYGKTYLNLSYAQIGAVLTVCAIASTAVIAWTGKLLDRFGSKPSLVYGFLFSALTIYAFTWSNDFLTFTLISILFGVASGVVNPAQVAIVTDQASPNHRGLAMGLYRSFSDVGIITGPLIAGILIDILNITSSFIIISLISLVIGIATLLLPLQKKSK